MVSDSGYHVNTRQESPSLDAQFASVHNTICEGVGMKGSHFPEDTWSHRYTGQSSGHTTRRKM
jgi:hypothetical protein